LEHVLGVLIGDANYAHVKGQKFLDGILTVNEIVDDVKQIKKELAF
jgi:hypothetical protein